MDPQYTSEGKLFAPQRYKDLVRERYIISKYTHTSYSDTANITPIERQYLLDMISEDLQREKDIRDRMINNK